MERSVPGFLYHIMDFDFDFSEVRRVCAELDAADTEPETLTGPAVAGSAMTVHADTETVKPGFSFSGKGPERALTVTLGRHEYGAVEDSIRGSAGDGRLIPSALRLYSLVRAYGYAGVMSVPLHNGMLRALCSPRNSDRCAAILEGAGLLEITRTPAELTERGYRQDPYRYTAVPPVCQELFPDGRAAKVTVKLSGQWGRVAEAELSAVSEETDPGKKLRAVSYDAEEKLLVDGVKEIVRDAGTARTPEGIIRKAKKSLESLTRSRNLPEKKGNLISLIVYKILKKIYKIQEEEVLLNIISKLYLSTEELSVSELNPSANDLFQSVTGSVGNNENSQCARFVNGGADAQSVKPSGELKIGVYDRNPDMSYYSGLSYGKDAVAACLSLRDLSCLAFIDDVPEYNPDGKLYSRLANIRRRIRRHVTFNGSRLAEAADIHSAHFTFLPEVFRRRGIPAPAEEIERWTALTRSGRLYDDIAVYSGLTRAEAKSEMQPFLSVKSRGQYIHGCAEGSARRRIVRYFEDRFPAVYRALTRWRVWYPGETLKSVCNEVESDLMNPVCDRLRAEGLHPFRVHDAVYLPEDEMMNLDGTDIRETVFGMMDAER